MKVTLTIIVHNQLSKVLHLERPNNNIHEGGVHETKVFVPKKKKLVTTLNPIPTLLYLHSLSVQLILNLFDDGFRTIECP
jgi:hypothetical protein